MTAKKYYASIILFFVAGRRWHPEGEYWSGNDLRYIQKLLGHKNRKITEIYIKVSIKDLRKITGPLDL